MIEFLITSTNLLLNKLLNNLHDRYLLNILISVGIFFVGLGSTGNMMSSETINIFWSMNLLLLVFMLWNSIDGSPPPSASLLIPAIVYFDIPAVQLCLLLAYLIINNKSTPILFYSVSFLSLLSVLNSLNGNLIILNVFNLLLLLIIFKKGAGKQEAKFGRLYFKLIIMYMISSLESQLSIEYISYAVLMFFILVSITCENKKELIENSICGILYCVVADHFSFSLILPILILFSSYMVETDRAFPMPKNLEKIIKIINIRVCLFVAISMSLLVGIKNQSMSITMFLVLTILFVKLLKVFNRKNSVNLNELFLIPMLALSLLWRLV